MALLEPRTSTSYNLWLVTIPIILTALETLQFVQVQNVNFFLYMLHVELNFFLDEKRKV